MYPAARVTLLLPGHACVWREWNINFTIYPFNGIIDPSIGKCRLKQGSTEPVSGRHNDWRPASFPPFEPQLVLPALLTNRPGDTDLPTSIRQGTVFGSVCCKFMQCQRKILCMLWT